MKHILDTDNDVYLNLALILHNIEAELTAADLEYMRMHLFNQMRKMENPEVMVNLNTITIFDQSQYNNRTYTTYINYIKDENGGWNVQTGERFSEPKNLIIETQDEMITYYISRDQLLAADVSTAKIIEHCFKERQSLLTTTFVFENGEWKEKFTRRNNVFQDTVTQHVSASRLRIRS